MKINELKPNQSRINLEADVVSIGETKSFLRFGRIIRVANATIKDETGEVKLTLWNNEIDKVKPNSKVRITNGFAKEFRGELTVTAGKFGKLDVIETTSKAEVGERVKEEADKETEKVEVEKEQEKLGKAEESAEREQVGEEKGKDKNINS